VRIETIGNATLFLGDCVAILPQISGVDVVVTSPPYNQLGDLPAEGTGMWARSHGGAGFLREWAASPYADSMDESEYQGWQNDVFRLVGAACSENASLFYNHQVRWRDTQCLHPAQWFKPEGWRLRQELIWDRAGGMMMNAKMFVRVDERILWFVKGSTWGWNQEHVGLGTIWKMARQQSQQGKEHPVAFPIQLPTRCIAAVSGPGDCVLDPFMGGGTTGAACAALGRRFIGIEIDPKYFEIACKRIEHAQRQQRLFA
jgi:site-specific DNA-methyltransferase (adenine-specific)